LIIFHHFKTGEELIREFVLYTNGAPFNKSHIPRVFAVLLERIWRMINALPGFKTFSTISLRVCNDRAFSV
jgi:hypothetical protein